MVRNEETSPLPKIWKLCNVQVSSIRVHISILDVLRSKLIQFAASSRCESGDAGTRAELLYQRQHLCARPELRSELRSELRRLYLMGGQCRSEQINTFLSQVV